MKTPTTRDELNELLCQVWMRDISADDATEAIEELIYFAEAVTPFLRRLREPRFDADETNDYVCGSSDCQRALEALKNWIREEWPNDPKLSDRGVRRGTCMVGGKAVAEAGAVTHGAVRCSAWLGVRSDLRQRWRVAAKRRVKAGAGLRSAASGRLRCSADGNAAEGGWGVGRKLPAKRTDARAEDVERSCADGSESEAQIGTTPLIAARVATWPKLGNAKFSKLVRNAARVKTRASSTDDRITGD